MTNSRKSSTVEVAICIRCGNEKREPWRICGQCGFDPATDEEALIKSVYLSTGRFDQHPEQEAYVRSLRIFATSIQAGEFISYDAAELDRLKRQRAQVEEFSPWGPLLRLFLPAMLFIGALVVVYFLLRYIRQS